MIEPPKDGWYRPDWQTETIVDMDGNDIPVDAVEVHEDGEHILAHYRDNDGKKWLEYYSKRSVASVILHKPFKVVPRSKAVGADQIAETNTGRFYVHSYRPWWKRMWANKN